MKKSITITTLTLLILILVVTMVACNPDTPGNNNDGNGGNNAPCTHADANYDEKCDTCGVNVDVVRTIANAEEWDNAIALNKSNNYMLKTTLVFSGNYSPAGSDTVITFDGVTKKWETKYFDFGENGEKEYTEKDDHMSITTKVDNKYYHYYKSDPVERWSEVDQEYYDNFIQNITCAVFGFFEQFTFNATTGQYEAETIVDSDDITYTNVKVAFVNGVMTGLSWCQTGAAEPIVVEITHGGVETIEYPEIVIN